MTAHDTTKLLDPKVVEEVKREELLLQCNEARDISDLLDQGITYAYRTLNHHTDNHFNNPYDTEELEDVLTELTTILKGIVSHSTRANDDIHHVYNLIINKQMEEDKIEDKLGVLNEMDKFFDDDSEVGEPN